MATSTSPGEAKNSAYQMRILMWLTRCSWTNHTEKHMKDVLTVRSLFTSNLRVKKERGICKANLRNQRDAEV